MEKRELRRTLVLQLFLFLPLHDPFLPLFVTFREPKTRRKPAAGR